VRFLPYERATLLTSLSPTEVARRLRPLIAPPGFALFAPRRPLRGTFDGTRFKVRRVLSTFLGLEISNAWQPIVIGEISGDDGGSTIVVRLRPRLAVVAFTSLWLAGAWTGTGALCLGMPSDRTPAPNPSGALAGVLVMLAFAFGAPLLMLAVFWSEARAARRMLSDLLEAEPPVR
jgi:hypothetical protein